MKKINIHLVLGGAVSAGAYTAGVLDYLITAIKRWNNVESKDYEVKLASMAGTSAGGMCGAILLSELHQKWPDQLPKSGMMYEAWVKTIDIAHLTQKDDLRKGEEPESLLNGRIIRELAKKVFSEPGAANNTDICNPDLQATFTVSNSRGVVYPFHFLNKAPRTYALTNHRDYVQFRLNEGRLKNSDWLLLANAAIATGSFPIGLPPQLMSRNAKEMLKSSGISNPLKDMPDPFTYLSLDGGLVDNEPLGLIRKHMKDVEGEENVIIMIDPFPFDPKDYSIGEKGLGDMVSKTIRTLRNQALFKTEELLKAEDKDAFFIAPSSSAAGRTNKQIQVAGGSLFAFSGFLHEDYRSYDYKLGLANCDQFIKKHFKVNTPGSSGETLILNPLSEYEYNKREMKTFPSLSKGKLATPLSQLYSRLGSVLDYYLRENLRVPVIGFLLRGLGKKKVMKRIRGKIEKDLQDDGLLNKVG